MKDLTGLTELLKQQTETAEDKERAHAVEFSQERFAIESKPEEWSRLLGGRGWRLVLRPGLYLDFTTTEHCSVQEPYLTRYVRNRRGIGKGMESCRRPIFQVEQFLAQLQEWGIDP